MRGSVAFFVMTLALLAAMAGSGCPHARSHAVPAGPAADEAHPPAAAAQTGGCTASAGGGSVYCASMAALPPPAIGNATTGRRAMRPRYTAGRQARPYADAPYRPPAPTAPTA